ncbi:formylglycine-generating enzyme family protein [Acidobacteria bacterium AH-259-L09]|nr:formylglycine-generating enzyme family protein [Acidobacteria bacterium AH-259-L09]
MKFSIRGFPLILSLILASVEFSYSQWVDISNVETKLERTEMGGPRMVITYDLNDPDISPNSPAYIFIRYSTDSGALWKPLPVSSVRGEGHGLVESPGKKRNIWWGIRETGGLASDRIKVRVRGIKMVRVPKGRFLMKSLPGGGYDETRREQRVSSLRLFYLAKHETTVSMYVDYLNEVGAEGAGWDERMSDPQRCGIVRAGESPNYTYAAGPGRENYPVTVVSWYDALAFLQWCGLTLPTEAQWEKAYRGGLYLDGDEIEKRPNPFPERTYPWGNEEPDAGDIHRCNHNSDEDGFPYVAPVCSFEEFNSPYGACDMAGNVGEWTLDWYSTSFHADLDGFRMIRGGSWRSIPGGVDAVTGATQLPLKGSGLVGFRALQRLSKDEGGL